MTPRRRARGYRRSGTRSARAYATTAACSAIPYCPVTYTLLRGPLESGQYVSLAFGRAAGDAGIAVSMGSRGDAYDTQSRLIGPAAAGSV